MPLFTCGTVYLVLISLSLRGSVAFTGSTVSIVVYSSSSIAWIPARCKQTEEKKNFEEKKSLHQVFTYVRTLAACLTVSVPDTTDCA